jgi:opacity protein-like surface antigen
MKFRVAAVFLAAIAFCGSAQAQSFSRGFYTSIGYAGAFPNFTDFNHEAVPNYLDGVEAGIGWRFSRFYSIEASYSYFTASKNITGESLSTTLQTGSIDAFGYLPFGWSSPWALFGDIGGTGYFASVESPDFSGGHQSSFGARAGGGLQYQFDENLGLRLSGRYDWANMTHMKSAEVFGVDLIWQR